MGFRVTAICQTTNRTAMNAKGRSRTNSFKVSPTFAYALAATSKNLKGSEATGLRRMQRAGVFAEPPPIMGTSESRGAECKTALAPCERLVQWFGQHLPPMVGVMSAILTVSSLGLQILCRIPLRTPLPRALQAHVSAPGSCCCLGLCAPPAGESTIKDQRSPRHSRRKGPTISHEPVY